MIIFSFVESSILTQFSDSSISLLPSKMNHYCNFSACMKCEHRSCNVHLKAEFTFAALLLAKSSYPVLAIEAIRNLCDQVSVCKPQAVHCLGNFSGKWEPWKVCEGLGLAYHNGTFGSSQKGTIKEKKIEEKDMQQQWSFKSDRFIRGGVQENVPCDDGSHTTVQYKW